jgi:hypothetical protein
MSIYEEKNDYVSHRGILKSCEFGLLIHPLEVYGFMNINTNLNEMKDGSVLYVSTQYPLQKDFFNKIHCKVILVIGDDDNTFPYSHFILEDDTPEKLYHYRSNDACIFSQKCNLKKAELLYNVSDYIEFIESEKIIHCFIQNCAVSHKKITKIPIGVNYHSYYQSYRQNSIDQEKMIKQIQNSVPNINSRKIKCFANFQFNKNGSYFGYDRNDAISQISNDIIDYESRYIEKYQSYYNQSQYLYVVSPHGNGLDCHRTWEALYFSCIPIVKSSVIDDLYNDLPVLIVKEWSDINKELLEKTFTEYNNKSFNFEKLYLKYWVDKIYSYKNNI